VEAGAKDSGRTDGEGRFEADASRPGPHVLVLKPGQGFLPERFQVDAPATGVRWVLRRGARVSGAVTDERGAPVPEATVGVWRTDSPDPYQEASGWADARGRFSLSGLRPGRYVVEATYAAGVVERTGAVHVELGASDAKDVTVRLEDGWTLSGQVVDEASEPVAGVRIVPDTPVEALPEWRQSVGFFSCSGPPPLRTGPDGRFTLHNLPANEITLDAVKEGYRFAPTRSSGGEPSTQKRLSVRAGTDGVRLVLERLPHIRGRLTGPDGAPLPAFGLNGVDLTDPGGAFAEPFEDSGMKYLSFRAPGMAPVLRVVETRAGVDVDLGEVRMSPGRRVSGRVLDARTSEPLSAWAFATSAALPPEKLYHYDGGKYGRADGRFELPQVEDGPVTLFVGAHGYLTHRQPLGRGDEDGLTVRLTPATEDPR
jgi:protocatechuate 3,4-dioxygenase beta subunit